MLYSCLFFKNKCFTHRRKITDGHHSISNHEVKWFCISYFRKSHGNIWNCHFYLSLIFIKEWIKTHEISSDRFWYWCNVCFLKKRIDWKLHYDMLVCIRYQYCFRDLLGLLCYLYALLKLLKCNLISLWYCFIFVLLYSCIQCIEKLILSLHFFLNLALNTYKFYCWNLLLVYFCLNREGQNIFWNYFWT